MKPVTASVIKSPEKLRFPKWGSREQDFWLDMFNSFSQALLPQESIEEYEKAGYHDSEITPEVEARMIARIQVAARLADSAVQEMLYRFFVHQKLKVRTKTKRRVSR